MQMELYKYDDGSHQFSDIRTVEIEGVLWFVGNDVAKTLGYSNTQDAIARHCKLHIPGIVYQRSAQKAYQVFRMKPYQWLQVYSTLEVCNNYQY